MAQIVKLRRSSVSGQKPTNTNLQLGELALNTTDGKVYMSKSGSLGPSIQELIVTDAFNTGSINLSGSLNITGSTIQIGDNTLSGNTLISGSLVVSGSFPPGSPSASMKVYGNTQIEGYAKFLPVTANLDTSLTGSYIFVSGSTDDLYFSQNGKGYSNVTRLRWLEGNLYTGLLNGGIISATSGGTTFNVAAGSGIIVNLNASLTENPFPTIKYVNWNAFTGQTLTYRTTDIQTFIGIDENGLIHQQTSAFNDGQYNTIITLGTVIHQNLSTVNATITYPNMAYGYKQRTYDFIKAFGPLKLSGLTIVPVNTLGLNVGSGTAWADGRNYQIDPNNPSYINDTGTAVSKIFRYHQISGTTFSQDTNNASGYTTLDVTQYNNNGTLTTVPGNNVNNYEWTIQRIFWYPNSATKGIVAYYGNRTYTSSTEAAANVQFEPFVEVENTRQNAVYLGAIAVRKDANWANSATYLVLPGGIFRNVGGSGGGGLVPTNRFTDLTDVDVAGAMNGDLVSYNTTSNKWEHGKSLTGNYQITGSLGISGSLTVGDVNSNYQYITLKSSDTNFASTLYNAFNMDVDGNGEHSAGIAVSNYTTYSALPTTILYGGGSGSNLTGGNDAIYFNNGKIDIVKNTNLTGSLNVTGSLSLNGLPVETGRLNKNEFYTFTSSYTTGSYTGSFKGDFSGSFDGFHTGSFSGNGYGLYNIPASGVTGLELNKIVSGSTSASVIDGYGMTLNSDLHVDGIITAREIHTSYVTSSILFESGSTRFGDTLEDVHEFTGSVNITGSLILNGFAVGTGKLDTATFELYTSSNDSRIQSLELETSSYVQNNIFESFTGSVDSRLNSIESVTGSYVLSSSFESFTGSYTTGSFTGSFIGDGSGLYNLPYSGLTDVPTLISGSSQIIDLGFTTTTDFNSFTSSYLFDSSSFDSRILEISGSVGGGGGMLNDGSFVSLVQSTPSTTWTFNHGLGQKYPIFQVFDTSDRVIIPAQITAVNSGTATITFPSAQAGRVIASLGTGPGGNTQFFASATTWSLQHNMGTEYPIVTVYDDNKTIVFPNQIKSINENKIEVYFSTPVEGYLNVAKGGHIISGSVNMSNIDTNGSGFVSSSVQIANYGFATTGSNRFNGNQTITGSITLRNAKIDSTCSVISSNTTIFNLSTFDGANFDYVVKNGSNMRAGNIMSVWNGSNSKYTETSTMDLGDTSNITFNVSGTGQLNAVVASGTWTVEVLYRALGCS